MDNNFLTEKHYRGCTFYTVMILCFCIFFMQISCSPDPGYESAQTVQGFSQSYVQDPLSLTLRTSKKEITIAGELELVLETTVPENMDVEFPSYSAGLGDFTLKDTRILPIRMIGAGDKILVVHQVSYLLEPYLSGTYTIPAMTVAYHDKKNLSEITQIITAEIEIDVKSLLATAAETIDIKDIKPPLSLPPDRVLQLLTVGLALLLAAFAAAGLFYWKKMSAQKQPAEVHLRPEEIALQDLEGLLAEDLLAKGEIKLFHLRISDILRHYIENRFGMKAPERTTEEFLTELSQTKHPGNALAGSTKALLTDFLTQCDLVKFARHEPTLAESKKTIVICRDFIEKTREKEGFKDSRNRGVEGKS